jgi:hypothetical protein
MLDRTSLLAIRGFWIQAIERALKVPVLHDPISSSRLKPRNPGYQVIPQCEDELVIPLDRHDASFPLPIGRPLPLTRRWWQ